MPKVLRSLMAPLTFAVIFVASPAVMFLIRDGDWFGPGTLKGAAAIFLFF